MGIKKVIGKTQSITYTAVLNVPSLYKPPETLSITYTSSKAQGIVDVYGKTSSVTNTSTIAVGLTHVEGSTKSETSTVSRSDGEITVIGSFQSETYTQSKTKGRTRSFKNDPKKYKKSTPVFIYDKSERMQLILSDATTPYKGGITEDLNGALTIKLNAINHPELEKIENEGKIVTQDADGNYVEFIIRTVEDSLQDGGATKEISGEGGEYELIDDHLPSYSQASVGIRTALQAILNGTRWGLGNVNGLQGKMSVELKRMSVKRAVHEIVNQFGGEISYRVEIKGNRITRRFIDVHERRGTDKGKRFEVGRDIISNERVLNSIPIKTALYGYGASDEEGNRLTFADVEWRKEDGDPCDKPLGQTWVGDEQSLADWGRVPTDKEKRKKRHKYEMYDGQEEDPAELLFNTHKALQEVNSLHDTYEADVLDIGKDSRLGDTALVINRKVYPFIENKASIISYYHDLNDENLSKVTLGHFRQELDLSRQVNDLEKDWNDSKGELEKKPNKIKNELEQTIDKELEKANANIEQAKKELEESMERIESTKIDLADAENAISNAISRPQDYVGYFDGDVAARSITLWEEVISKNAIFTGTVQGSALTFLRGDFEKVNIIDANIKNAVITGQLDGVDGRFIGTVIAENILGRAVKGVTFDTDYESGFRINMTRQELYFYESSLPKMRLGFRNQNGSNTQEPYIVMGYGKPDGSSKFFIEKKSESVNMSYSASTGYSTINMGYSGSMSFNASGSYIYLNASYLVDSSVNVRAPDFVKSSTVKIKDNIKKYEGDALGIVLDTDVFSYHFKHDLENMIYDNEQIGFLAEGAPMLKTGDSVSVSKAVAINWVATQDLNDKYEKLAQRMEDIELMMEVI